MRKLSPRDSDRRFPGGGRAAAPRRGIPPQFYGVVSAKFDPTAAEFDRMGAGKVGRHRVSFAWASVQTNGPESFDWSRYDAVVGDAAENGIQTLATIYGTPAWAAARPNHPPEEAARRRVRDLPQGARPPLRPERHLLGCSTR